MNGEEIITTPKHPFYVPQKGWVGSIQLRAGDILILQNGQYVIVEKVQHEILEEPITVYNFEVEDFHTYYVGESTILVHNANCGSFNGSEVTKSAEKLGYQKTNYRSHGQTVYYNSRNKTYITRDVDGHNGGVWKMAKSVKGLASKETRMGTYDENLVLIGE